MITSGDVPAVPVMDEVPSFGGDIASAIQVTATNSNASAVPASYINVDLFDGSGDQLATDVIGLDVETIVPGVTITTAATAFTEPGFSTSTNLWDTGTTCQVAAG